MAKSGAARHGDTGAHRTTKDTRCTEKIAKQGQGLILRAFFLRDLPGGATAPRPGQVLCTSLAPLA